MCRYRTIYYTHPCGRTDSEQMVLVTCPRPEVQLWAQDGQVRAHYVQPDGGAGQQDRPCGTAVCGRPGLLQVDVSC